MQTTDADAPYDSVIIGSSPLMLLQALELARTGLQVCVADKNEKPGGAWRTTSIDPFEVNENKVDSDIDIEDLEVEVACHLIESFSKVYEYLEEMTNCKFVPLERKPIRLHSSGFKAPYFSRILLIASGLRLLLGFMVSAIFYNRGSPEKVNNYLNFKHKLKSFLKYQLPLVVRYEDMLGPKNGYAAFYEGLWSSCLQAGVKFAHFDVRKAEYVEGIWNLFGIGQNQLYARQIFCSTSASLKQVDFETFLSTPTSYITKNSIVIAINKIDLLNNYAYVAFWKDKYVSRISRINLIKTQQTEILEKSKVLFLVELRSNLEDILYNINYVINKKIINAGIVKEHTAASILGRVTCTAAKNTDLLPVGQIGCNFHTLHSSGNLAAGIAAWLDSKEPHKREAKPIIRNVKVKNVS